MIFVPSARFNSLTCHLFRFLKGPLGRQRTGGSTPRRRRGAGWRPGLAAGNRPLAAGREPDRYPGQSQRLAGLHRLRQASPPEVAALAEPAGIICAKHGKAQWGPDLRTQFTNRPAPHEHMGQGAHKTPLLVATAHNLKKLLEYSP